MKIAVVTDSTSSLNANRAAAANVAVVPIGVNIGADNLVDGENATADRIAQALREFIPVSTSRPNPAEFGAVYKKLAASGVDEIVSIHLSSKVSGTFESAELAAKESEVPVHVVDSAQVGIATGFVVLNAARAVVRGDSAFEVVEIAKQTSAGAITYFYVDTLEYLRRGGRISGAAAVVGSALAVKPLLSIDEGIIKPVEKVRTSSKALARLHDLVVTRVASIPGQVELGVQHLDARTVATNFAGKLANTLGMREIEVSEVGASLAAHVGPGMISVAIVPHLVD